MGEAARVVLGPPQPAARPSWLGSRPRDLHGINLHTHLKSRVPELYLRTYLIELLWDAFRGSVPRRQTSYARRVGRTVRSLSTYRAKLASDHYIYRVDTQGVDVIHINWEALGLQCLAPRFSDRKEPVAATPKAPLLRPVPIGKDFRSLLLDLSLKEEREGERETEAAERRSVNPRPADPSPEPRPAPRLVAPVAALARTAPPPRPPAASPQPQPHPRPAPKKLGGGPDGPLLPLFDMGPTFRAAILRRWQETGLQAVERVLSEPLARRDLARTEHALTALVTSDATIEKPGGWLVKAIRSAEQGKPYEVKNTHPLGMSRLRRINAAINDAHGPTRSAQIAQLEQQRFQEGRRLAAQAEALESVVAPLAAPTFTVVPAAQCPMPAKEFVAMYSRPRALPPPEGTTLREQIADLDRKLARPGTLEAFRVRWQDAREALVKRLPPGEASPPSAHMVASRTDGLRAP